MRMTRTPSQRTSQPSGYMTDLAIQSRAEQGGNWTMALLGAWQPDSEPGHVRLGPRHVDVERTPRAVYSDDYSDAAWGES